MTEAGTSTRRRRRPPLTRDQVLETALRVSSTDGLAVVTMRRLATELDADPPAIYRIFRDKAELLDAMADQLLAAVEPSPTGSWDEQLRRLCLDVHDALHAHPELGVVFMTGSPLRPNSVRTIEAMLGILRGAGFAPEVAARAQHILTGYLFGFVGVATFVADRDEATAGDFTEGLRRGFADLPGRTFPFAAELAPHLFAEDPRRLFAFGLDLLLTGLAALLEEGGSVDG
jgi:AcrR family transcriptional regulator